MRKRERGTNIRSAYINSSLKRTRRDVLIKLDLTAKKSELFFVIIANPHTVFGATMDILNITFLFCIPYAPGEKVDCVTGFAKLYTLTTMTL